MKMLKLLVSLGIVWVMYGCATQPELGPNIPGRIAVAVDELLFDYDESVVDLELMLKHQESGEIYKKLFKSGAGKRVDYFENLAPGQYFIEKCNASWKGDCLLLQNKNVEVEVKSGQTSLFPFSVILRTGHYPFAGLDKITGENFWDDYAVEE